MSHDDLLPCPFCGSEAVYMQQLKRHSVFCKNSLCSAEIIADYHCPINVLTAWNTRHTAEIAKRDRAIEIINQAREALRGMHTYNPDTHILIAKEDVPEGLEDAIKFFSGKDKLAKCIKGVNENTDNSLVIHAAAALIAEKMEKGTPCKE